MEHLELCKARLELRALIWKKNELGRNRVIPGQGQLDLPTRCLQLLRQQPRLAQETFRCHDPMWKQYIYPFFFLLITGANLECLEEAYEMYPAAVAQKVTWNFGLTGYPLHTACGMGAHRVSSEIIIFLAHAHPGAVGAEDSRGCLPIQVLLRNSNHTPTLVEVETLMDMDHSTTMTDSRWTNTRNDAHIRSLREPLALAIKRDDVGMDILDFLVQKYPANSTALRLGRYVKDPEEGDDEEQEYFPGQETNYTMTREKVRAISKLFYRLQLLSCPVQVWQAGAFEEFMAQLSSNNNNSTIADLSFRVACCSSYEGLQQLLVQNTTIRRLKVNLSSLVLDTVTDHARTFWEALVEGMRHNRGIKRLYLAGLHPSLYSQLIRFEKDLVVVLQEHNTVLEKLVGEGAPGLLRTNAKWRKQIHYWTSLNQLDRGRVRGASFTIHNLISLLEQDLVNDRLDMIYGLLGENPGLWSE